MDIFGRMRSGEPIRSTDTGFEKVEESYVRATRFVARLNTGYHTREETLEILRELTGSDIDDSVQVALPFYTDFGRNIRFGKGVFVNSGCTFLDQGGIEIGDDVMFGPNVSLVTSNHPLDPADRRAVVSTPIRICRNAWIGAGATILPGLTIGENSVVAAAAVVTRDVPPNTVVAGNPAREIKRIDVA